MESMNVEECAGPAPTDATSLVPGGRKREILSITFHLETLRLVAFVNFFIVMIVCGILTKYYVDIPVEETVIYEIFGFNHACNVLDHHPAREVGAILLVFMIFPLAAFIMLSHFRTKQAFLDNEIPQWLLTYSNITSPFNLLTVCWCYMWFVNNPDDTYGFLAHYIPYLTFQIMLALVAIHQAAYLIYIDKIPFGLSPKMAIFYAVFLAILTVIYILYVVTMLAETPIWDSVNNDGDRLFAQIIAKIYSVFVLIFPILFSAVERRNGDVNTITFS